MRNAASQTYMSYRIVMVAREGGQEWLSASGQSSTRPPVLAPHWLRNAQHARHDNALTAVVRRSHCSSLVALTLSIPGPPDSPSSLHCSPSLTSPSLSPRQTYLSPLRLPSYRHALEDIFFQRRPS